MRYRAWIYVLSVITIGTGLACWAFTQAAPSEDQWALFLILLALGIFTEFYRTEAVRSVSHSALPIIEFAALLLLNPMLFVLIVALPLLLTWFRARRRQSPGFREWYKQPFNISMTLIAGFAAYFWGQAVHEQGLNPTIYATEMTNLICFAALIMVTTQHLLLKGVILLVTGRSALGASLVQPTVVVTDFALLLLGYIAALLWSLNPLLMLLTFSPLFLMYRALWVPHLEQRAETDSKTGLLNAGGFMERAAVEFARARSRGQPLAFLMADLDLLRDINNRYGHLAGDLVLEGIGKVLQQAMRRGDIAGRFGGEEFALLLPDTPLEAGRAMAQWLCETIAATAFSVPTSATPLRVTMSIGVAVFPNNAPTLEQLVQEADHAAYYAKASGRNCVRCRSEVPETFNMGGDRLSRTGQREPALSR